MIITVLIIIRVAIIIMMTIIVILTNSRCLYHATIV